MVEFMLSVLLLIGLFSFIMGIVTAVRDRKEGRCLWCNFKKTGRNHLYHYKEDGIPTSERFYEYRCSKCGTVKNYLD